MASLLKANIGPNVSFASLLRRRRTSEEQVAGPTVAGAGAQPSATDSAAQQGDAAVAEGAAAAPIGAGGAEVANGEESAGTAAGPAARPRRQL
ncbi:MAG: hypothetical protein KGJ43_00960, partial [Acidobacteriota bacterium]|nr:hypothetical protein [Acidobacteriota bacterium]